MPRGRRNRRRPFRQHLNDSDSSAFNPGLIGNTSQNCTVLCQRCSRVLNHYNARPGQLCHVCRKLSRNEWSKRKSSPSQNQFVPVVNPVLIPHSNELVFDNNTIDHSMYPRRQAADNNWERKVYSTPYKNSKNFNREVDNDEPLQIYRTVQYKQGEEYQTVSHQQMTSHQNSNDNACTPSLNQRTRGFKRKQGIDHKFAKRLRPNALLPVPQSDINYFSEDVSPDSIFSSNEGFQRNQRDIPGVSKKSKPSPSLLPPPNLDQPYSEDAYRASMFCSNEGFQRIQDDGPKFLKKSKPSLSSLPPSHFDEPYSQLSRNIWNHFNENCQTDSIYETKMLFRDKLQNMIQSKFRDSDLFIFGSSMTGFASKTSDVDMCLMFHNYQISKKNGINILWELRSLLIKYNYLKRLEVIPAKVPILRFRDTMSGFEVDLNINNPTGVRNSQLLRSYARMDERVRPLILAIKWWARIHKINDAKNGTLSSYSLGLMVIHYLQYGCYPPILPPLQTMQPDKFRPNSDVRTLLVDEDLPYYRSENHENIGQLFAEFLHYYSKTFDYKMNRISVRLGHLLPRVEKRVNKKNELKHWIDIEEPFECTNVARSVNNPKISSYIKSVFDSSWDLISRHKVNNIVNTK